MSGAAGCESAPVHSRNSVVMAKVKFPPATVVFPNCPGDRNSVLSDLVFGVILTDHWNVKGATAPHGVHCCDETGMRNFWSQGKS